MTDLKKPAFSPWPYFDADEVDAVRKVLSIGDVNYWTGQRCREFESHFAQYFGSEHAVAVTNGTVALDLALLALGIGEGDEVIVTPRSFIASVSAVVNVGATPVFADVDRDSGNITSETIEAVITDRTRAILPVHLAGWPCDMPNIMRLAKKHDCFVIEDCAQAHGATINGQSVGTFGHVGAWSFCQDKIMSTGGEGGMVSTNDKSLWSKMWSFKDHGKSWTAVYEREHKPGYRWLHESFGTNWRMMEIQAAIGLVQLQKLPSWVARRHMLAARIGNMLGKFAPAIRCPQPPEGFKHAHYRQYAYVEQEGLREGWDRDRIIAEATKLGLPVSQGSCSEIYMETAFDGTGLRPKERLPVARELGYTSLAFLTHPTITDAQMDRFLEQMESILQRAVR